MLARTLPSNISLKLLLLALATLSIGCTAHYTNKKHEKSTPIKISANYHGFAKKAGISYDDYTRIFVARDFIKKAIDQGKTGLDVL